jgi:hypothetical protein
MTRLTTIRPEFVEFIPKELEDGVLYISIPYSTTVHKCACGCGSKITLPISPAKWRLLWDGDTISMWPSVGNWSYPCQSHYWIERNHIEWAPRMTRGRIETNRALDKADRENYLKSHSQTTRTDAKTRLDSGRGLIDRLRGLIRRRR